MSTLLTQQEVIELKDELKTLQDKEVNFKFSLDEFDKAAIS